MFLRRLSFFKCKGWNVKNFFQKKLFKFVLSFLKHDYFRQFIREAAKEKFIFLVDSPLRGGWGV